MRSSPTKCPVASRPTIATNGNANSAKPAAVATTAASRTKTTMSALRFLMPFSNKHTLVLASSVRLRWVMSMRWNVVLLFALSVAACAVAGPEVGLFAAPLVVLVGVLLSGRFPGERAILARRSVRVVRRRPVARHWIANVERSLASQPDRSLERRRGPPAVAIV